MQNELVELIINKHSIDLTMISKTVKVYVRSKRGRVWPNLKGINGKNEIMVFIDFSNGIPEDAFYVINALDWNDQLKKRLIELMKKHPDWEIKLDEVSNSLIWPGQITKSGKPYIGIDLSVSYLIPYQEKWEKLL